MRCTLSRETALAGSEKEDAGSEEEWEEEAREHREQDGLLQEPSFPAGPEEVARVAAADVLLPKPRPSLPTFG